MTGQQLDADDETALASTTREREREWADSSLRASRISGNRSRREFSRSTIHCPSGGEAVHVGSPPPERGPERFPESAKSLVCHRNAPRRRSRRCMERSFSADPGRHV